MRSLFTVGGSQGRPTVARGTVDVRGTVRGSIHNFHATATQFPKHRRAAPGFGALSFEGLVGVVHAAPVDGVENSEIARRRDRATVVAIITPAWVRSGQDIKRLMRLVPATT